MDSAEGQDHGCPSRPPRTQRAQVWVAAQSHMCASEIPRHRLLVRLRASSDAVPARTFGFSYVDGGPHQQDDQNRGSTLPSSLVATPQIAPSLDLTHLPMWPPTRLCWPSSSSVQCGGGPGCERVSGSSTGVQRSRGESEDQHFCPRHGSGRGRRARCTKTRSRRGRLDTVAWGTTRH